MKKWFSIFIDTSNLLINKFWNSLYIKDGLQILVKWNSILICINQLVSLSIMTKYKK